MSDAGDSFAQHPPDRAVRSASDGEVEQWLQATQHGDANARELLCCWAFVTASDYYRSKVSVERHLTMRDADELASEFFIDFEKALSRMRTATHFSRRVLKKKLGRFLARKKTRQRREQTVDHIEELPLARVESAERPWERWTDSDWYRYQSVLLILNETDEITRSVVQRRVQGATYHEISVDYNLSEAALRMRVARFYAAVRERYKTFVR